MNQELTIVEPEIEKPTLAICCYGLPGSKLPLGFEIKFRSNSPLYNVKFFYNNSDEDVLKNLWLVDNDRRRHELANHMVFDTCLAININDPIAEKLVYEIPIRIPQNINKQTLFFVAGDFDANISVSGISMSAFFCSPLIFSLACTLYQARGNLPVDRKGTRLEQDFFYLLKSLKIKTECIHYANRSLFERPA